MIFGTLNDFGWLEVQKLETGIQLDGFYYWSLLHKLWRPGASWRLRPVGPNFAWDLRVTIDTNIPCCSLIAKLFQNRIHPTACTLHLLAGRCDSVSTLSLWRYLNLCLKGSILKSFLWSLYFAQDQLRKRIQESCLPSVFSWLLRGPWFHPMWS